MRHSCRRRRASYCCLTMWLLGLSRRSTVVALNPVPQRVASVGTRINHERSSQQHQAFSALAAVSVEEDDPILNDPLEVCGGTIPYPKALSPSSILEFKKCPQSFFFQYLLGLRQPTSKVLIKGSVCHSALEKVFDLDPEDRTVENLQNLFRAEWQGERKKHLDLFQEEGEYSMQDEIEWGQSALHLLENYVALEDPRNVVRPNPIQREVWVRSNLPNGDEQFLVRGIVDRLDMIKDAGGQVVTRIVDYKTGKAPHLKYAPWMNEKILEDSFYQLKVYALLLRETARKKQRKEQMELRYLRLLHLTNVQGEGQYLDYDLGTTLEERNDALDAIQDDITRTWNSILALVDQQDPSAFVGCDRSFCYCHKCRDSFLQGTVWEPPSDNQSSATA